MNRPVNVNPAFMNLLHAGYEIDNIDELRFLFPTYRFYG